MSFNKLLTIYFSFSFLWINAQYGDCTNNIEACNNPSFTITPSGFGNVEEFTDGFQHNISNPQVNPNNQPGNLGCLLDGELNSTWLMVTITSDGVLEFSLGANQGLFGNCYDWIMWPYDANTCAAIQNNTLPPVACNWNGNCNGLTGMSAPANFPAGADQSNFENPINVNSGDQFIICFSNYSSATTNVPLSFFGTASVNCGGVTSPTICYGETATIEAFNGTAYNWDTSTPGFINTNAAGDNAFVNPTVTTDYTVQITSGNGTIQNVTTTVTVLPQIVPTVSATLETCIGDGNGILSFSAPNANAPVTYSLTGASTGNNTNGTFNNLPSGNYTINITDANGCTATLNTTLDPGPVCCGMTLTTTTTNNDCFGDCNGTATLDTAGTTGPATIQWFDTNGTPINGATGLSIYNLCAGNYSVQVTDPVCTLTETAIVTEPSELIITDNSTNLNCFQDNSGSIIISANGGTPNYQYSINSGSNFQQSGNFDDLPAANYSIVVNDANNCSKTQTITLTEPAELNPTFSTTDNTCNVANGPCNGNIIITPNGGTQPYTYQWNNGLLPLPQQNNLCQGVYNVTVTDNNNCTFNIQNINITEPDELTVSSLNFTSPICIEDCDGTIEIISNNAINYSIDNGQNFQNNNYFENLCTGNYQIIISDANSCIASSQVALESPGAVIANFDFGPQPTTIQESEITFESTSINADEELWYTFINEDTLIFSNINPIVRYPEDYPGNYEMCLVASNINNCIDTICQTVVIDDMFFLFVPNAFTPNGDGENEVFYPIISNYKEGTFEFLIFNRWGNLIFESSDPSKGWNGTHISSPVKNDIYIWKITVTSNSDVVSKTFTGHVTLFR